MPRPNTYLEVHNLVRLGAATQRLLQYCRHERQPSDEGKMVTIELERTTPLVRQCHMDLSYSFHLVEIEFSIAMLLMTGLMLVRYFESREQGLRLHWRTFSHMLRLERGVDVEEDGVERYGEIEMEKEEANLGFSTWRLNIWITGHVTLL